MKIWTFLFALPECSYASVRVAAKSKQDAIALMSDLPDLVMEEGGYVCDFAGQYQGPAAVLRVAMRAVPTGDALAQLVALWLQPHDPARYSRMGLYP